MKRTEEILIVDDQESNRRLLEVLLKRTGYKTKQFCSGDELLEYLKTTIPALVLLDIMMPGIDGISAAEKVREDYVKEELPIIMVTTLSESSDLATAIAAGANDYVTKPVDRLVLMARIGNQLALREAYLENKKKEKDLEDAFGIQQAIGDELPAGLIVHDIDKKTVYSNNTLAKLCDQGICSIQNLPKYLLNGEFYDQLSELFSKVNEDNSYEGRCEFKSTGMDTKYLEVVTNLIPLRDSEFFRLWSFRDMTEIKLMERKLEEQIRLETVGVFATGVAHNFNNVMASVSGAGDLLSNVVGDNERGKKCLDIIKRALDGGKALTSKMFALKPIDFEEGSDPTLVKEIVESIINDLSDSESSNELKYNIKVEPADLSLPIDPRNLATIIRNLVVNSTDASDVGAEIDLELALDEVNENIKIAVRDFGKGMSLAVKERVSEPFFTTKNVDRANKIGRLGNGLGMWNVHNLVLSLNGSLDIRSSEGQGTEVLVTLPVSI